MTEIYQPLSAKYANNFIPTALMMCEEMLGAMLKNLIQDGYPQGTEPPANEDQEFVGLLIKQQETWAIIQDPNAPPGLRQRAQSEARRFMELQEKFFGTEG